MEKSHIQQGQFHDLAEKLIGKIHSKIGMGSSGKRKSWSQVLELTKCQCPMWTPRQTWREKNKCWPTVNITVTYLICIYTCPTWTRNRERQGGSAKQGGDKNSWPTANEHTWGETASFTYYAVTPDNKHSTNQVECFKQLVFKQNSS